MVVGFIIIQTWTDSKMVTTSNVLCNLNSSNSPNLCLFFLLIIIIIFHVCGLEKFNPFTQIYLFDLALIEIYIY